MRANASSKRGEANVERRAFMQTIAAMVLSSIASGRQQGQMTTVETRGDVPYRTLGKTGVHVSMVGMGGFHLGQKSLTEQDAIRLIHTAIDRGINFMDNSWDYNDGASEIRMGKALQGGYRDKVFLMTKLDGRTNLLLHRYDYHVPFSPNQLESDPSRYCLSCYLALQTESRSVIGNATCFVHIRITQSVRFKLDFGNRSRRVDAFALCDSFENRSQIFVSRWWALRKMSKCSPLLRRPIRK